MKSGVVCIFLMFILTKLSFAQLVLTSEEKKWLEEHPVIKVANEDDWPPFDYSEKGKALGLTISYVDLLLEKLGIRAEYINGHSWNELLDMSKNYQIDLMPCIWYAKERTEFLNYTSAYISNPQVLIVNKKNKSIHKVSDLKGKKVAFIQDYATKNQILKAYPEIIPVIVKSPLEALLLVNLGSADACVDSLGQVSYQIDKNLLTGLKIAGRLEMDGVENINNLYMAVRKDWPLLHSALQKAMNSLTEEEKLAIHEKWLLKIDTDSKGEFKILDSEKAWIAIKNKIKFAYIDGLAPLQYKAISGKFSGITAEYAQQIEKECGNFFKVLPYKGFKQGIESLQNREVDVLSTVIDRSNKDLLYTQPFISVPVVVLTRKETSLISNIASLKDKKLAIVKGNGLKNKLLSIEDFKHLKLFENSSEAMRALGNGEVYAFCDNLATITYLLQKEGENKFVIANTTNLSFDIGFAVRKDWKQMNVILERFVESLSEERKLAVEHRWFNLFVEESFTLAAYWKELLLTGLSIVGLFVIFIFWNRSLSREIEQRLLVEKSLVSARQHAEKSDQAKGDFLAMMSHEIRTPLNGIIGMSELLGESGLTKEQKKECDIITSSGKSLLTIINDILDFSKIEAGKLTMEERPFNLRKSLESIVNLYQNTADENGLYLRTEIDKKIFGSYKGDEGRLKQVLLNLVSNGLKFTESGGVTIGVHLVNSNAKEETLEISIKDTGIGIPEEVQGKLFQEFSQADSTTSRKYGGTGLGLAISKKIVGLLKGKIVLQSDVGNGSAFIITLTMPKANVQISQKKAQKQHDSLIGKMKVLLAEDNKVNQKITIKVLSKLGCEVTLAENGLEVLQKLSEMTPNIILMDCHMPEMDGYKATAEIRKQESYNDIPIVAMTANALQGDKEKCLEAGMDDYISKPIDKEKLMAILSKYSKQTT